MTCNHTDFGLYVSGVPLMDNLVMVVLGVIVGMILVWLCSKDGWR